MVSASKFVEGGRIKWEALVGAVLGGIMFAVWEGFISVINQFADLGLSLLDGFADFLATVVQLNVGTFSGLIASAWNESLAVVEGSGPLGFAVGVGIVMATFYVVAEIRGWL